MCVWESVWGWAWCHRVIKTKNMPSFHRNHRARCHGNAAGSSSSSHQWASAICYRGKPGLLPRRPEAVCSSSNEELFLLVVTKNETLSGLNRYLGLLVYGGNIDLLIENWISASECCLYELFIAGLLIQFYCSICHNCYRLYDHIKIVSINLHIFIFSLWQSGRSTNL